MSSSTGLTIPNAVNLTNQPDSITSVLTEQINMPYQTVTLRVGSKSVLGRWAADADVNQS